MLRLLLALLFLLAGQEAEDQPDIIVDHPGFQSLETGRDLPITVSVYLADNQSPESLRLLPLALENLLQDEITMHVAPLQNGTVVAYQIQLRTISAGNAALGELQFEYLGKTEAGDTIVDSIYTAPGFSLQVVDPPNWALMWAIVIGIVVLLVVARYIVKITNKGVEQQQYTSTRQRRLAESLRIIDDYRKNAEFNNAVESAFTTISEETSVLAKHLGIPEHSAKLKLDSDVKDYDGLFRLGEEVRYGGYKASAGEARFALTTVKRIVEYIDLRVETQEK